jgi:uncharacterized membrane protein
MARRRTNRLSRVPRFRLADLAQQFVGGFLLSGAFVVTEEVWVLARNLPPANSVIVVGVVAVIGYAALYRADTTHDAERERDIGGVPVRFLSLMFVSFGSVTVLALALNAPNTFLSEISGIRKLVVTAQAIAIGAIFSVVGAATADSVF